MQKLEMKLNLFQENEGVKNASNGGDLDSKNKLIDFINDSADEIK